MTTLEGKFTCKAICLVLLSFFFCTFICPLKAQNVEIHGPTPGAYTDYASFMAPPLPKPDSNRPVTPSALVACAGDTISFTVPMTQVGVVYRLRNNLTNQQIGSSQFGNTGTLTFPSGPLYVTAQYSVQAEDTSDNSMVILDSMPVVTVNPLPRFNIVTDTNTSCPGRAVNFTANSSALEFDGTNDFVRAPNIIQVNPSNNITVEAWVRTNTWATNRFEGVIASTEQVTPPPFPTGYTLSTGNNGQGSFQVAIQGVTASNEAVSPIATMSPNTWHHLAGTYDGISTNLYIDGSLVGSSPFSGSIEPSSLDLILGRHGQIPAGRFFTGFIDEVRIWSRVLDSLEIQALKDQQLTGIEPGLEAYYDFNDGGNNNALADHSPNNNPGSLNNFVNPNWPAGAVNPTFQTYTWDFGDGNSSPAAAPSHTYTSTGTFQISLTATDVNGCSFQDTSLITIAPTGPVVNLGNDTTLCPGNSLTLDAGNPGATFSWSSGAITQTLAASVADTYAVAVTDLAGCVSTDTIIISPDNFPGVNLGPDTTLCTGDTLVLDAGPGASSYLWSNGDNTQSIVINAASNWYVDVLSNNNCAYSDSILITFQPGPTLILGPDTTVCPGIPVTLNAGNPGSTYLWSNGATTQTTQSDTAGTYAVTVTFPGGCSRQATRQINFLPGPIVNLGPDIQVCQGNNRLIFPTVSGAVGPYSYMWSTGSNTPSITATTPGNFSVTVTSGNGCTGLDSVNFGFYPNPGLDLGPDTTICTGDTLLLDARFPSAANYLWSTGATSDTLLAFFSFSYWVDVQDTNGCFFRDTLDLTISPRPTVTLFGLDSAYCPEGPLGVLQGSPAGGVYAGPGVNGILFDPGMVPPGFVTVTYSFTDTNGCSNSASQTTRVRTSPQVQIQNLDPSYCFNDQPAALTGTLAGGTFSGNGMVQDSFFPSLAGVGIHAIAYEANGPLGCIARDTSTTEVLQVDPATIQGLAPLYCTNSGGVALTATPPGGTFAGPGIAGSTFFPNAAGPGIHNITYIGTQQNGCVTSDTQMVEVVNIPMASFTNLPPVVCEDATPVVLNGNPGGGVFSGPGMNDSLFMPATAGPGQHSIIYTYTAGANCAAADTQNVFVNASPVVSFSGLDTSYCLNAADVVLSPSPTGGQFNGQGMNGNTFSPTQAGAGSNYLITYTYTDGQGCSASDSQRVSIFADPTTADAGNDQIIYLGNDVTLSGNMPVVGSGSWTSAGVGGMITQVDSLTISVSGLPEGPNRYTWTIANGSCISTDEVLITRLPFPTERGFSPNGDGMNDNFVISGLESFPQSNLLVFTRWGEKVFASDNYQNDWDGKNDNGNDLADDTYFFILELSNGEQFKGYVTLKR